MDYLAINMATAIKGVEREYMPWVFNIFYLQ